MDREVRPIPDEPALDLLVGAVVAVEELEVSYNGPEMEIGFNARYLMDIASQVMSDTIEFALADQGSPSLVRSPGDEATLFVLMPMRV